MATLDEARELLKQRNKNGKVGANELNNSALSNEQAVEKLIQERKPINFQEEFNNIRSQSGIGSKSLSGLKIVMDSFRRGEAAIANAALSFQKGNSVKEASADFLSGITGEKLGELGDVMRSIGAPEPVASTVGFMSSFVAPLKGINAAARSISKISKATDKGLQTAGKLVTKAADDAVQVVGKHLDDAYKTVVKTKNGTVIANDVAVDGVKALDSISDLPKSVINHVERELGQSLDDFLLDFNIAKARKLKSVIGELRPNSFSKSEKGAVELILDKKINKAYSSIKKSMQEALGKDYKNILDADESFVEVLNASRFIRKKTFDPVILKPTKTSRIAKGLEEVDSTAREALNTIKFASKQSRKGVNKAVRELELFNRREAMRKVINRVGSGALLGGTVGAAGGKVFQSLSDKAEQ